MERFKEVLAELQARVTRATTIELRAASAASKIIKISIIAFSLVLGAMQFLVPQMGGPQLVGIGAAIAIGAFTLAALFLERDHAEDLAIAAESTQLAQKMLAEGHILTAFEKELDSADSLIAANRAALEFLESSAWIPHTEESVVEGLMRSCERALMIAAGFDAARHWTFGVYRVQSVEGEQRLVNMISHRSVPCDTAKARSFGKGEGVPGIAWASARPLIVGDVHSHSHAGAFDLSEGQARPADGLKYRAIAAVPVMVAAPEGGIVPQGQVLWGMVVASYDIPRYMDRGGAAERKVMPFRLLAASVGAAVGVAGAQGKVRKPAANGVNKPGVEIVMKQDDKADVPSQKST